MVAAALIITAWLIATGLTLRANVQWYAKFVSEAAPKLRDPDAIDPVEVIGLPRTWR